MTSYARQSFSLRRIGVVVTTLGAGQAVLLTQVPVISELCGLSVASIGGIVALGTLCFMLAGPLWGAVSDRRGRKPVVMSGLSAALLAQTLFVLLLVLLAAGVLAVVPGVVLLGLSRLVYGLGAAGIYPACQAWAVEESAESRRLATLSTLSAAANLGRGFGPLLVLPALGVGVMWPLAWLVILPLLGLALAASVPAGPARATWKEAPAPPLDLRLCALFSVALLGTAAIGQLQVVLGPVLTDFYGMSAGAASSGTAILLLGAAAIGVLVQWGVVRRLRAPRISLSLGAALLLIGVAVLWIGLGSLMALPGLAIFVAGVACLVPAYTALASEHGGHNRRGRLFGLLSLMHTGGYTVGFAAGGWIYTQAGGQPLSGMLVCILLLTVAVALTLRSPGRAADSAEAVTESP